MPLSDPQGLSFVALAPQRALDAGARDSEQGIGAALLSSLILLGAITYLLGKSVVGTLRRFAVAAHSIAGGRLGERVEVRGRDEFAQLARAFNDMASQLEQQRLDVQTERARVRDATQRLGEALVSTHDSRQLLRVVVESAVEATGATGGIVIGRDGEVARAGDPDAAGERIAFPLRAGASDFGHLVIVAASFDAGQIETARSLTAQAVVALENAQLHRLVQHQALIDSLTGLANRRSAEDTLRFELARSARFDGEICLVLADLDDFKQINDRYGHPFGDELLKEFANAMRATVRESDVAARWGGEEFALVLPGTGAEGGALLAERIREIVESRSVAGAGRHRRQDHRQLRCRLVSGERRVRRTARRRRFGALRRQAGRQEPGRHLAGVAQAPDWLSAYDGLNFRIPPGEMASEQEDFMAVDTASMFARVIQEHLELKRRNSALEHEMPLGKYMHDDPFENHPLFKTEEQARIEDTIDGLPGIESHETSLDWPTTGDDTFIERAAAVTAEQPTEAHETIDPEDRSDENLWSRSRDFDWGD